MNITRDRSKVRLLYGRKDLCISVPRTATTLTSKSVSPLANPNSAIRKALNAPIGTAPLAELVRRRRPKQVAITISDITRPVPNELIVKPLLDVLHAAGIRDEQVVIVIGTGMHRPSTSQERTEMLGVDLLERCEVIDHCGDDPDGLIQVSQAPPVSINQRFAEADFRIVTGLIEPHFMAGFSGGRKGVCPALADCTTVQRFHSFPVLADPKSTTGLLDGNPCHIESLRVARLVGVDFLVNVAIDRDRKLAGIYCGDLEKAHLVGTEQVGRWNSVQIDRTYDLIVTHGGGYPLDQTFYQSVKGIVTPLPAMHDQTTVLITSHCGEGIGSPPYTKTMMQWGQDWRGFIQAISTSHHVVKDQWQYQMHARVLSKIGVEQLRFVTDQIDTNTLKQLAVNPVLGDKPVEQRCQQFIDNFIVEHPSASIAVFPEGPYTYPLPLGFLNSTPESSAA